MSSKTIFQGENILFKIILRDENDAVIPCASVLYIRANLYNEASNKIYIQYTDTATNATILTRKITDGVDTTSFDLPVYGVDSDILPPGRYIIEIEFATTDVSFGDPDGNKRVSKQNGTLFSVIKSI